MLYFKELQRQIGQYHPCCEQEKIDQEIMLHLMDKEGENILTRRSYLYHITASGFTRNENRDKLLMVHHNIYNSWSWIGGHADGESNLLEVAMREVKEESGVVHIRPEKEDIVALDILTTKSHVKKGSYVPAHLHLNVTYSIIADEKDQTRIKVDENSGVRWIPIDCMEECVKEEEMKQVYRKILEQIS